MRNLNLRQYIKNNLKQEIYRNLQKRQQNKINNELNELKFDELAKIYIYIYINQDDLVKIKQYNALNLNILQKIAHQRNKNTTGLKKKNLIYTLIRSEKSHKKDNYIKYLNKNTDNEIHNEINKLRLQLLNISPYLKKEYLNQIRKRLYDIEKKTSKNRAEKKNYVKNYQKDQLILNIKDNIYQLIIEIITIHIYKILSICLIV